MSEVNISQEPGIEVAWVHSENGPAGSAETFHILESRMPELRGRRMYGVFFQNTGDYYCAVRLDDVQTDDMGFEHGTIPGGYYARRKYKDWGPRIGEIATWFSQLQKECADSGLTIDDERPSIEFYRSLTELIIMAPVIEKSKK